MLKLNAKDLVKLNEIRKQYEGKGTKIKVVNRGSCYAGGCHNSCYGTCKGNCQYSG